MNFSNIEKLKENGFVGFKGISDIKKDSFILPDEKGVYFVIYPNRNHPKFLKKGTGGWYKGKNPNVSTKLLKCLWLKNSKVIYIGKADNLKRRIKKYIKFGQGENVSHYGGRLIWQIENRDDLTLCWKLTPEKNPREVEKELIKEFEEHYKRKPFANLIR